MKHEPKPCQKKGCTRRAGWHPIVAIKVPTGQEARVFVDLSLCTACADATSGPVEVLGADVLRRISDALHGVANRLVWTPLGSHETNEFHRMKGVAERKSASLN